MLVGTESAEVARSSRPRRYHVVGADAARAVSWGNGGGGSLGTHAGANCAALPQNRA
jgi:hypothetical protein